ncbi:hypothetical protein ACM9XC_07280 [Xanthomonas sacchari]
MARVRFLIVFSAILFLALVSLDASAQSDASCNSTTATNAACPDEGQAYAAVNAALSAYAAKNPNAVQNAFICWASIDGRKDGMWMSNGIHCDPGYYGYGFGRFARTYAALCTDRKSLTSTFSPKSGSISCDSGCEQAWFRNADGTSTGQYIGTTCNSPDFPKTCGAGFYWNGILNVCEPTKEECPEGQKTNSVGKCSPEPCPDGMVQQQDGTCKAKENECPQGQVKGPDGSCVKKPDACSAGQAMGADGTCKPDKDGDGKPDDEDSDDDGKDDKSSFSGGDSCDSPPSCSGDAVMCGQARIQWRIDCNTRRNRNIAGGACSTPPICTGDKCDAMEYASLLVQWRTACATEKLAAGNGSDNSGDQPAWTKVSGMSQDPGVGASADDTKVLKVNKLSTDDLDQSGFGGGGSCIGVPSSGSGALSSALASAVSNPPPFWCNFIAWMKAVFILVGAVVSAMILTGRWST